MAYAVEDARQLGKCMKIVLRDGTRKNVNQQAVARRKICNAYRLVGVMRGLRMAKDYDETKSFTNSSTSYVQYCLPIIRCFMIRFSGEENPRNFYLTKEVLNVLKNLRENQNIGITVETEEMRKLGIVYLMNEEELKKILRNFEISKNEFTIIKIEISYSFNKIATPFISSYGTFIKLSTDAFDDVLRYISQNMQLFQNIKQSDFPKVIKWIEVNLKDFFFVSDKLYAIETWRIDIMIEKARNELQKYKSNLPMFEVPEKSSYEKQEIMEYIQNMMKSIGFNIEVFELNYRLRSAGKVNFKRSDIYSIYNSCCRCSVMNALNVFHLAHDMQVYHRKNHIEKIVGKDFDKYFEMLYNFQTSESRQSNNVSEIMKKRFEKEKEKEEMIENMKIENLELKKNMEDLRRQLENMKNEAENKRKIFHKEISRKNEENLKIAENLSILKRELKHVNNELKNTQEKCSQIVEEFKKEITMKDQQWERINRKNSEKKRFIISLENELKELKAQTSSTKELKEVKKELKGLQGTYSNLREESRKNIEKLKEENRKMKENRENEKNKYEKSLKLREKENMEISGKLQKSVENSEKLNSIIKNLEKDLRNSKN
ncbi:unnamed protein product [Caenorhabditis angaria]|uniref:Uncharacterized protein n=1 Tax=Caenorhabditis angaria TaxID=860376 RepID=A0A9P1IRI6_9PELO|nr:unnamed protein product [Caenorhabditis angaria]